MDGEMTLALELETLRRLADPTAAVDDARRWTEYVGVVSAEPTYVVTNFTRQHRIRQDFFSGPRGVEESLRAVREQFDTARHVFVGTDETTADAAGWEYLDVEAAAGAAGWTLVDATEATTTGSDRDDWP
jgi:hypothetical protein